MRSRPIFLAALTVLLVLALAAPASAQEARTYWRHSAGHFENTKGNRWIEKHNKDTYIFRETERTPRYVQLYNRGRDCTVRLLANRCMVRFGNAKFEEYYTGRWVK